MNQLEKAFVVAHGEECKGKIKKEKKLFALLNRAQKNECPPLSVMFFSLFSRKLKVAKIPENHKKCFPDNGQLLFLPPLPFPRIKMCLPPFLDMPTTQILSPRYMPTPLPHK